MADDTFSSRWLTLREPVDHAARARELVAILRRVGRSAGWARVVDLGAGTGSNLRYLVSRLPWADEWTVVDHDPALLAEVRVPSASGCSLRRVVGDLAGEGLDAVAGTHLVTASALLDLVSESWLGRLAHRCADERCGVHFAMSYDGTFELYPDDPMDPELRRAVNRHQVGEKGMGTALGPGATEVAASLLREAEYRIWIAPSPWLLDGADHAPLARTLLEGWMEAAVEARPEEEDAFRAWGARRMALLDDEDAQLTVRVGHLDLLAIPEEWAHAADPVP